MKANIFFLSIIAFFLAACTINLNQPNANSGRTAAPSSSPTPAASAVPAQKNPWSVVVCSSRAQSVILSAGSNETNGALFATWKQDGAQRVFELPAELQNLSRIYFKAIASDKSQVEMCVLYAGKAKKRVEFDDQEDVIAASTDTDELDKCRCTQ